MDIKFLYFCTNKQSIDNIFMKTTLNENCYSHTSIIVFLTSCGLDVDKITITIKHVT